MRHEFSVDELEQLRRNPWVHAIQSGRVVYKEAFKAYALKRKAQGYSAQETFLEAGIPLRGHRPRFAQDLLKKWQKTHPHLAVESAPDPAATRRGRGRPRRRPGSPEEHARYLEAENSYLKAEIAFLERLRAKRAE